MHERERGCTREGHDQDMWTDRPLTMIPRRADARSPQKPANRLAMVVVTIILCAVAATETWVQAHLADQAVRGHALEGTVAAVDVTAGTIRVSRGPFGSLATSLEITSATQVRVVGRPAALADIRDSATVRVGYTVRDGRSVATSIDLVLPPTVTAGTGS